MLKTAVFRGLEEIESKKIIDFLGAKKEKCNITETIMTYNSNAHDVGIVLSGTAELAAYDYDGNKTILERYGKDAIFGQMFSPTFEREELTVTATAKCEILFFRYERLSALFRKVDHAHTTFLFNFMDLMTEKLRTQANHLAVLGKRGLRAKLNAYFALCAAEAEVNSFTLPFSLYALADFLGVDRSAMQREMKKMREEGIIASKGKRITFYGNK